MRIKYCKSCGHKNQYVGLEPKFCANCGKSMSPASESPVAQSKNVSRRKLHEDETDIEFVPNIANLQYSVSPYEKKTFKMEELFDLDENDETKKT